MRFSRSPYRPHRGRTGAAAALAAFALGGLTAGPLASPAVAQSASFTSIADSTSPEFTTFGIASSINASGTVAFGARREAGGEGIYRADGAGTPQTITVTLNNPEYGLLGNPLIDDGGNVAFIGIRRTGVGGGTGLYAATAPGAAPVTLATTGASGEYSFIGGFPNIRSGVVTFQANRNAGGQGIFRIQVGGNVTTTVLRTDTNAEIADLNFSPGNAAIPTASPNGLVTFLATREQGAGGDKAIYRTAFSTGNPILVARTSGSNEFTGFGPAPTINDSGRVAFAAQRVAGGSGIYVATGAASFNTIATTADRAFSSFTAVYDPAINNIGTVVFSAETTSPTGAVTDKAIIAALPFGGAPFAVLRTGDSLFGSTVTALSFSPIQNLNDANQISFGYTLANGVSGVARADLSAAAAVPEAGTLALLPIGALALAGAGAARRRGKAAAAA